MESPAGQPPVKVQAIRADIDLYVQLLYAELLLAAAADLHSRREPPKAAG